jgi:hypothetical protein
MYSVALAGAGGQAGPVAAKRPAEAAPHERPRPKIARIPNQPRGSVGAESDNSALDYLLGDKEDDALVEIFDQLSKADNNGKIEFPDWARRFGHLAPTLRAFLQMHLDKFELIPGKGGSFTVDLR